MQSFCDKLERLSGVKGPALRVPVRSPGLVRLGAGLLDKARETVRSLPSIDAVRAEMASYFWYVDSTKARTELGWVPRDPVETLADTIEDLRSRGVVWPRA